MGIRIDLACESAVYEIELVYPNKKVISPNLKKEKREITTNFIKKMTGLDLDSKKCAKYLEMMMYNILKIKKDSIEFEVPPIRIDIWHDVDIADDIVRAYGVNNIKPMFPDVATDGNVLFENRLKKKIIDLMIGLGFQEVLTYTLTNPNILFNRMNMPKQRIIEISNPKIQNLTCLRNQLLPSLLDFLSNNLHIQYPQKIFELGTVTIPDDKNETKTKDTENLAAITTHSQANFSEVMSALDAFFMNFGLKQQIKEIAHPSFIKGRVGAPVINGKEVGVLGEIHPKVLEAWELENPVAAFELNLHKITTMKKNKTQIHL